MWSASASGEKLIRATPNEPGSRPKRYKISSRRKFLLKSQLFPRHLWCRYKISSACKILCWLGLSPIPSTQRYKITWSKPFSVC